MSKFLNILHEALSDHKYGYRTRTFPSEAEAKEMVRFQNLCTKRQAAVSKLPPKPVPGYEDELNFIFKK